MRQAGIVTIALALLFTTHKIYGADTASITAKSDDGIYIGLDDGTKWLVSKSGAPIVHGWAVGDDVVEIDDSKHCSGTELINADEQGEAVCVRDVSSNTASITDKSDDGEYLELDDGSRWIVSDADQSTSTTWLVSDDVIYLSGSKTCPSIEIIDIDEDGDEVCAYIVK